MMDGKKKNCGSERTILKSLCVYFELTELAENGHGQKLHSWIELTLNWTFLGDMY